MPSTRPQHVELLKRQGVVGVAVRDRIDAKRSGFIPWESYRQELQRNAMSLLTRVPDRWKLSEPERRESQWVVPILDRDDAPCAEFWIGKNPVTNAGDGFLHLKDARGPGLWKTLIRSSGSASVVEGGRYTYHGSSVGYLEEVVARREP